MTGDLHRRAATGWWGVFGALAVLHLGTQLQTDATEGVVVTIKRVTQWLLMPALIAVLVSSAPRPFGRLTRWSLVGLVFCFGGDLLPGLIDGQRGFLAMVGAFLVAQLVFSAGFWPYRGESFLRRQRPMLLVYVVAMLALIGLCKQGAGHLFIPVAFYGCCLTLMALLASGLGPLGALGGALFFVSDALIALGTFATGWTLPMRGILVMATYIVATALLVTAVIAAERHAESRVAADIFPGVVGRH